MAKSTLQTVYTNYQVINRLLVDAGDVDNTTRAMAEDFISMVATIHKNTIFDQTRDRRTFTGNPDKLGFVSSVSSVGTINSFAELDKYARDIIKRIQNTNND